MISKFSIHNFRSIVDITCDLSFSEGKAPNGYKDLYEWVFCEPKTGHRIVPCLALYGANASGKTNIIKALSAFHKIAIGNFENVYFPNKINTNEKITKFSLDFIANKQQYTYTVEYDDQQIIREELFENTLKIYSINNSILNVNSILTKGIYNKKKLEEIFNIECTDQRKQYCTFLQKIARNYRGLNKNINYVYEYFQKIEIYPTNNFPFFLGN